MAPKKAPKIPKKFQQKLQKQEGANPVTAEDFLDIAIEHEESGDRWVISDLSKSLRFYQKAYESYRTSINIDPTAENLDAYYNLNRLIYHVHSIYDGIPPVLLRNIEGCDVVGSSLQDIKTNCEDLARKFEGVISWDFYYNLISVYTEVVESDDITFEAVRQILSDAVVVLHKIFDIQLPELDSFLNRLVNPDEDDTASNKDGEEGKKFDMIEQVTPAGIFDTVLSGARLILNAYGSAENEAQLSNLKDIVVPLWTRVATITQTLLSKFDPSVNTSDEYNLNIQESDIIELRLLSHSIEGIGAISFKDLESHWSNLQIDTTPRHLLESESFQTFKDRHELSFEQQWEVIAHINKSLKRAQDLVREELQFHINAKTNEISTKVKKSVDILLQRADNELWRSSFPIDVAVKNQETLKANSVALLKNGMALAQTNCGLRETISAKVMREKARRECIVRLVFITKDTVTEDDLIRNLGAEYYKQEVDDLKQNEVYKRFL